MVRHDSWMRILPLLCLLVALAAPAVRAQSESPREGDCWSYANRRGEDSSFVIIRKLTVLPDGKVIAGISLAGLKVKAPRVPGGVLTEIAYLAVEGDALLQVLRKRVTPRKVPVIAWEKEHAAWWADYGSKGQGGATAMPLADVIGNLEFSLASQR